MFGLVLAPSMALAQMYEWVDEQGRRHFSDQLPPPGISYQVREEDSEDLLSTYAPEATRQRKSSRKTSRQRSGRRSDVASRERREQEKRCAQYLQRMEKVQDRLRRGYREPQGNRLRQQRRDLSDRYQRECQ
ncbi:MAG: hypothetical protein Tsb002_36860 [Wenzhouxiangellaceae bacterium]